MGSVLLSDPTNGSVPRTPNPGPPDEWGALSSKDSDRGTTAQVRTVQSKFLDLIRIATESMYLELVVVNDSPNKGYAYVQKKDELKNLYSFRFEFTNTAIILFLEGDGSSPQEGRLREVEFRDGPGLEKLLNEVTDGIREASKAAFHQISALAPAQSAPEPAKPLNSLSGTVATVDTDDKFQEYIKAAARVWGQTEEGVKAAPRQIRYRRRSHKGRNIGILLLVVLLLLFVPVIRTQGSVALCGDATCAGITTYVSVVNHFTGIGGEYAPSGSSPHYFIGSLSVANGTSVEGFGLWRYYFSV